ncbi:sensor histidine kinase [Nocardiopsis sp. NPDC058631]|uniref:sensor histidine kinase n=1 Tax=Nocardiopsis sp. NPDC058631 TaxID=3346566 RepID=UPI003654C24F
MREGTRETALRWVRPAAGAALWTLLGALTVIELFGSRDRPPLLEASALVLALAVAAALSRSHPLTALGVMLSASVLQMAASATLRVETFAVTPWLALLPLGFLAGLRSERVRPVAVMAALACTFTLAAFVSLGLVSGHDTRTFLSGFVDWLGGALAIALTTLAPLLLGRYLLLRGRLSRDGWAIAERMERARAADADRARLRERARIATRMHDSLGHDLALIAVRAAALEMSAPEGSDQRSAAGELRTAAHEANLRLREVIGVLREGEGGVSAEPVAALVRRATDAGMSIRLLREGTDPDPATPGGAAVHRVVQESLTNAAKYAPGAEVTVRVVRKGCLTRVSVLDTGPPGDLSALPARRGSDGSGLAGLRSLVEGLGGGLDTGPAPEGAPGRGFSVRASVPDTPPGRGSGGGDPAGDPSGPGASETRRALTEARGRARQRLVAAVAVPVALGAGAVLAGFALLWWIGTSSVLPPERYERISVGDDRALVERELPRFAYPRQSVDNRPPDPAGSECSYYLVRYENGLPPVYRLCFADGVLVSKDEIRRFE